MPDPGKALLITGGAGFIGCHLALHFKARAPRRRVIALDNLKRRGSELNLARLKAAGVEFVHGDVRCAEDLSQDFGRLEALIECSAEPSVLAGYGAGASYVVNTNLQGAVNCFELARRQRCAVLFLSTSRVYPIAALNALRLVESPTRFELAESQAVCGASQRGIAENFTLEGPRSLYGASKLSAELLLQEYSAMYGIPAVINRCGVIAGPGQLWRADQGVFTQWLAHHYFARPLSYIGFGGEGKQARDVLHVQDLAELLELELERAKELSGEVFNVGGGASNALSLREATALCAGLTGRRLRLGRVPETRPGDVRLYITDNEKVERRLGWRPRRDTRSLFEDILRWLRRNESALRNL